MTDPDDTLGAGDPDDTGLPPFFKEELDALVAMKYIDPREGYSEILRFAERRIARLNAQGPSPWTTARASSFAPGGEPMSTAVTTGTSMQGPESGPGERHPIVVEVKVKLQAIAVPEAGGGYSVAIPALRGCVTEGETIEEVQANIVDAAEGWLASMHDRYKEEDVRVMRGEP